MQNPSDTLVTIVTPQQVEAWTNVSVCNGDVVRAQGVICLVGRPRPHRPADWLDEASRTRICSGCSRRSPGRRASTRRTRRVYVALPYIPGASSIANGDVSITFRDDAQYELVNLAGNAQARRASRLSWMKPVRSVSATPFLSNRGPQPSTWVPMTRRAW